MKFILVLVALAHVVLSQDTSTTPVPAFKDTNANGVNAGNMNGVGNPGNMNPGNMNPGNMNPGNMNPGNMNPGNMNPGNMNPGNMNPGNGLGVNNYPMAAGGLGGGSSTTVIPGAGINGAGINAAGQAIGTTIGGASVVGGGDSSDSSEESQLELPVVPESSDFGGAAVEEGDTPDTADGAAVNAGTGANGVNGAGNVGVRGDQEFNEIGDTPDGAENMVDADMGEQIGKGNSAGVTAAILVGVVAMVAAAAGVGLYVVKQRRNIFSSSNV